MIINNSNDEIWTKGKIVVEIQKKPQKTQLRILLLLQYALLVNLFWKLFTFFKLQNFTSININLNINLFTSWQVHKLINYCSIVEGNPWYDFKIHDCTRSLRSQSQTSIHIINITAHKCFRGTELTVIHRIG